MSHHIPSPMRTKDIKTYEGYLCILFNIYELDDFKKYKLSFEIHLVFYLKKKKCEKMLQNWLTILHVHSGTTPITSDDKMKREWEKEMKNMHYK